MKLNSKTIGDKIATARKKKNLSQADIAEEIPISPQAVGKWERGESLPDIMTLSRLAEILEVDLNYFSDTFNSIENKSEVEAKSETVFAQAMPTKLVDKLSSSWNMSKGNWIDADFSGLKNLKEKFSSSNIKNCKFIGSDMSELMLSSNNVELSDFSESDFRNSKIRTSNISKNEFGKCSFIDALFSLSNISKCNFNGADFSGTDFEKSNFENNYIENAVWVFTTFNNSRIGNVLFQGVFEDCKFEGCAFSNTVFQDATFNNCFFKDNKKLNKVEFINCKADNITYSFLKSNKADLSGITLIS